MSKFNFNIDIEDNELLSKSIRKNISQKQAYEDSLYVDLGLESGILWSAYNIGVNPFSLNTAKDWIGNYYAWGEITPKNNYNWETYKYSSNKMKPFHMLTKYCYEKGFGMNYYEDRFLILEECDDAAFIETNGKCIMPSGEDTWELIKNTTQYYVSDYNDIEGLNGVIFKSNINNEQIFIPCGGWYGDRSQHKIDGDGSKLKNNNDCKLWTSSLMLGDNPDRAYRLFFDKGMKYATVNNDFRCIGLNIRGIIKEGPIKRENKNFKK